MNEKAKRIIGITGGIGSGKTFVLDLLRSNYNAVIIEADKIGHKLQEPTEAVYNDIVKEFGTSVLEAPCTVGVSRIDREKLGAIVFKDDEKLKTLNKISHPAIHKRIEELIDEACDNELIFLEAAILTETSLVSLVEEIWYVYADTEVRLERLQQYRGISRERAAQIMANQPDDDYFREKCNEVIDNSGDIEYTLQQIKSILDTGGQL